MTNEIISTLSSRPMRCAIYARTATEQQAGGSVGAEQQIDQCKDAARKMGWTVVESCVRTDRAWSGTSLHERNGLQQLITLATARPRSFDYIICDSVSRLCRKLEDFSAIVDRLTHNGIGLLFVADDLNMPAIKTNDRFYVSSDFDEEIREPSCERDEMRVCATSVSASSDHKT